MILGFNKKELISVAVILAALGTATYMNLRISLRRERDFQRKNDIKAIHDALLAFHIDTSSFPPSFEGKIVACFGGVDKNGIPQAIPCNWHTDSLGNIFTGAIFLEKLPTDPKHNSGARYYYISNGRYFQIYGALEGKDEAEYSEGIVARNIMCGNRVCNYGRGFLGTPLDKSIEEYENELRQQNLINEK
jgi:hypothetical protein